MTSKLRYYAVEMITAFLVLLFLYTAIVKLREPSAFAGSMRHNHYLKPFATTLSIIIPSTELAITTMLFIPSTRKTGLIAATLLMAFFTLYVALMLLFTKGNLPCTCGGVIEQMSWQQHLIFNTTVTIFAAIAIRWYPVINHRAGEAEHLRT